MFVQITRDNLSWFWQRKHRKQLNPFCCLVFQSSAELLCWTCKFTFINDVFGDIITALKPKREDKKANDRFYRYFVHKNISFGLKNRADVYCYFWNLESLSKLIKHQVLEAGEGKWKGRHPVISKIEGVRHANCVSVVGMASQSVQWHFYGMGPICPIRRFSCIIFALFQPFGRFRLRLEEGSIFFVPFKYQFGCRKAKIEPLGRFRHRFAILQNFLNKLLPLLRIALFFTFRLILAYLMLLLQGLAECSIF